MADQILQFIITAQNNAKQAFREAESQLSGLQNVAKKMSSGWQDTVNASKEVAIGLTVAGTAAGAFGMSAIKAAASIETQKIGFKNLLGSMEAADEAIKMIQKDAASTPFEFAGLVEANKALTMVTGDAKKSEQALMDVGKALAAAGKGQAELDRIIINLQQIGNVGKVSEMDIRQFGFAGVNILQLLADYYGTTKEAAGEMLKDSKDAFGDLTAAFYKAGNEGGKFADAFANAGGSANQMASNLSDSWNIFLSGEGEKLLVWYKKTLELMSDFIQNKLPEIIKKIEDLTKWFSENKTAIAILAGVITALLVPSFISAAAAIGKVIFALTVGNPWGLIIGGIVALALAIYLNWDAIKAKTLEIWGAISAYLGEVWNGITTTTQNIWNGIKDFFSGVWEGIQEVFKFGVALAVGLVIEYFNLFGIDIVATWQTIVASLQFAWTVIQAAFSSALNFIQGIWTTVWTTVSGFLAPIWEGIKTVIGTAWQWISDKFNEVSKPISDAWAEMWNGMGDLVTTVWDGVRNAFKSSINFIIDGINTVIRALNSVASKGGSALGMKTISIPTIPRLASGGIVTSPTLAMIGEAGPEAVLPLSSAFGGGMGGYGTFAPVINIMGGYYLDRDAADEIGEKIIQKLKQTMKIG